jgi:hypothetical protein
MEIRRRELRLNYQQNDLAQKTPKGSKREEVVFANLGSFHHMKMKGTRCKFHVPQ